jgi:hypothetical protein
MSPGQDGAFVLDNSPRCQMATQRSVRDPRLALEPQRGGRDEDQSRVVALQQY